MSLLGVNALRRGISIVIGPRYQILEIIKFLPQGVYLCKSIRPTEYNDLVKVKALGHKLVWQDQEGLVEYKSDYGEMYYFDDKTLPLCDSIFAVNKIEYENLIPYTDPKKIIISGNLRFQFCKNMRNFFTVMID